MVELTVLLARKDSVCLNQARLDQLITEMGETGAQNVICRALEALTARLSELEEHFATGRTHGIHKQAKSLIGIAEQIGMDTLAQVARDVHDCSARHDRVALSATLARLIRIGDCSLLKIWELQDLSG